MVGRQIDPATQAAGQINDSPRQNPAYRFADFLDINPDHLIGIVHYRSLATLSFMTLINIFLSKH